MSQDAIGQLKHLKTARARWPFPDEPLNIVFGFLCIRLVKTVKTMNTIVRLATKVTNESGPSIHHLTFKLG